MNYHIFDGTIVNMIPAGAMGASLFGHLGKLSLNLRRMERPKSMTLAGDGVISLHRRHSSGFTICCRPVSTTTHLGQQSKCPALWLVKV